jgi:DNA-binding LacI/PurR family transcriptional regulator
MKISYRKIYDDLLKQIQRGDYRTGTLLPTDLEFAAKYKVSRPTVARALSMLVDDGFVGRKSGYGTFITKIPRSFHWNVGLIIPGLGETETFEPICSKIAKFFESKDVKFHWTSTPTEFPDIREEAFHLCRTCIEQKLDGVFFTPIEHTVDARKANTKILNDLADAGIQVVLLDRDVLPWPQQTPYDLVGIDNIQAGFVVTQHLIRAGCTTFVFATHHLPATTVKLRIMGCREALLQSGLPPNSLTVLEIETSDPGAAADEIRLLQKDALICVNDVTAATLMRSLIDKGTKIPDQLQITGFDDVHYSSLLSVPLTTYRQPYTEIGVTAAATMLERLKNPSRSPRRIFLKGELFARQSTRPPQQAPEDFETD